MTPSGKIQKFRLREIIAGQSADASNDESSARGPQSG
jgi:hypothetical protein